MAKNDRHSTGGARPRRIARSLSIGVALAIGLSACQYKVALFGDVPYSTSQEPAYERLLQAVNADGVTFSTHLGDIQASSSTCTDATVQKSIGWFDSLAKPLIYTPGDNEWTDCSNQLFRLSQLRTMIFRSTGDTSRGATTRSLTSQASLGYPENATWTEGAVTYVTVHIVGSSDNKSNTSEWTARRQADLAWLNQAFTSAKNRGDKGVVVMAQSGLRFERVEGDKGAYESIFQALRNETLAFPGQVLYVHGDGHTFRNDAPMLTTGGQTVANFRRIQVTGGSSAPRWFRLTVDTDTPGVFTLTLPPTP